MTREEMRNMYKQRAYEAGVKFFGEGNKTYKSNQYFTFKHVLDDDTIIINTNNVKRVKGNLVLIVDNDKAVYVKEWNFRGMHNYDQLGDNVYLVKLQRQYFKPYTFSRPFEGFSFNGMQDFDFLKGIAEQQDIENMPVANGLMFAPSF